MNAPLSLPRADRDASPPAAPLPAASASAPRDTPPGEAHGERIAANDPRADARRAGRLGAWALALGVLAIVAWASLAPLDEGVPAPATVMLDTKRKAVQHLTGGIVTAVLVREGDEVVAGQPLLVLDPAATRANLEAVRQRYLSLRAAQGRLQAERDGLDRIPLHEDLRVAADDPHIRLQMSTQAELLATRRQALQADLAAIDESIEGQRASLQAWRAMLASRQTQLRLLEDELGQTRALVADGYAPRNRQLELERMVADTHSAIADLQGNLARGQRAIGELTQRAQARRGEYRKEVGTQLAEVLRDVDADGRRYAAASDELRRMEVRAPSAGQVVGLAVQSTGAVVQPAQKLMDIVPLDEPLLLEARVPPHLVDRLRPGLPVDARFASFAHAPQLVVDARVASLSTDVLTDPQSGVSYYLARVAVTPEGRRALGDRRLQPGMPAELVFRTGERTLLTYLLHPLLKRMAASMKEE